MHCSSLTWRHATGVTRTGPALSAAGGTSSIPHDSTKCSVGGCGNRAAGPPSASIGCVSLHNRLGAARTRQDTAQTAMPCCSSSAPQCQTLLVEWREGSRGARPSAAAARCGARRAWTAATPRAAACCPSCAASAAASSAAAPAAARPAGEPARINCLALEEPKPFAPRELILSTARPGTALADAATSESARHAAMLPPVCMACAAHTAWQQACGRSGGEQMHCTAERVSARL